MILLLKAKAGENAWVSSWLPTLSLQHVVGILDFGFLWQCHCPAIQQFNDFGLHLLWDSVSQVLRVEKRIQILHVLNFFLEIKLCGSSVIYITRCMIQVPRWSEVHLIRRKNCSSIRLEITVKRSFLIIFSKRKSSYSAGSRILLFKNYSNPENHPLPCPMGENLGIHCCINHAIGKIFSTLNSSWMLRDLARHSLHSKSAKWGLELHGVLSNLVLTSASHFSSPITGVLFFKTTQPKFQKALSYLKD